MELIGLIQYLLNGLFSASVYAMMALGLTLIFGVLRIGDLAQGALYAVGAYAVLVLTADLGLHYFVAVPLAILLTALLSAFNGQFVYRQLESLGVGPTFIGAVALLLIFRNVLALVFSWNPQQIISPFGLGAIQLGVVSIETHKLLVMGLAGMSMLGLWFFLYRGHWGKALRALAQNYEAALTMGIDARWISMVAFALAGAFAGGAGALMAPLWPFDPSSGTLFILKAFAIAVIAQTKMRRVIAVAVLVGVGEVLIQAYWRAEFSDLFPFLLLAVVLVLQPQTLSPEVEKTPRIQQSHAFSFPPLAAKLIPLAMLMVALLMPLWIQNNFWLHLLILMGIYTILVNGLDLLTGYTGIPSLAQAGLWGVGAYASALLAMRWGWSFPGTLFGAVLVTVAIAWVIGQLGLRLRGRWTSFTFIIGVVLMLLFESFSGLTGGSHGLVGVPPIEISFGVESIVLNPFRDKVAYFYLVLGMVGITFWLKSRIVHSRMGRALIAIREDEGLAKSVGVRSERYKVRAFLISAAFAGISGSLYAHYAAYLHPQLFTFSQSFNLFVMNMVGGAATLLGAVLGPAALVLFTELTRSIHGSLAEIIFSILLLIVLIYLPDGLIGGLQRLRRHAFQKQNRIAQTQPLDGEEICT